MVVFLYPFRCISDSPYTVFSLFRNSGYRPGLFPFRTRRCFFYDFTLPCFRQRIPVLSQIRGQRTEHTGDVRRAAFRNGSSPICRPTSSSRRLPPYIYINRSVDMSCPKVVSALLKFTPGFPEGYPCRWSTLVLLTRENQTKLPSALIHLSHDLESLAVWHLRALGLSSLNCGKRRAYLILISVDLIRDR